MLQVPGTAVTGLPPGTVTGGTVHATDAVAQQARIDALTAYNVLAGLSPVSTLSADLVGLTLIPGVYVVPAGTANLSGALTLDGRGNANAAWVFQVPSTLITSPGSVVNVINTGAGAGVYLNTDAAILCGRAFALEAAVTLDTNRINNNNTAEDFGSYGFSGGLAFDDDRGVVRVPVPGALLLACSGMGSALAFGRRSFSKS